MKQWYEKLFENYSQHYEQEVYTQGTEGECDFIEKDIGYDKSVKILDIGCGTGRHSIEMTKRGYSVTGIDLSESMLGLAQKKARQENLAIDFRRMDARALPFKEEFDLAIMLCEGSFPLMETDEMNFSILENAYRALKKEGKFIFTTLNGLFPLFHSVKDFLEKAADSSGVTIDEITFDLMTFRDHGKNTVVDDDGREFLLESNERYYVPSEITWLLGSLGFKNISIHGAKLGAFSRNDRLRTTDFEMLVLAEK